MVRLLSVLIYEFCWNGHRLPAGYKASDVSVRPGCMHADVTHLLLQAVDLPHEMSGGMTRQAQGKAAFSLPLNNQQCQADNVPENERLFGDVEIKFLTRI